MAHISRLEEESMLQSIKNCQYKTKYKLCDLYTLPEDYPTLCERGSDSKFVSSAHFYLLASCHDRRRMWNNPKLKSPEKHHLRSNMLFILILNDKNCLYFPTTHCRREEWGRKQCLEKRCMGR